VRLSTLELLRQAEQELDDGSTTAPKTLESLRRQLLRQGDIPALEQLLDLAGRLDDNGALAYATQQNLKLLRRRAELHPAPGPGRKPPRPVHLAIGWIVSLAVFPVVWVGMVVLWALGSAGPVTEQQELDGERLAVGTAAVVSGLGIVGATVLWVNARRRYPPETCKPLRSREGIWSGVVALALLGTVIGFSIWLWTIPI
jgi:hypothetical protein